MPPEPPFRLRHFAAIRRHPPDCERNRRVLEIRSAITAGTSLVHDAEEAFAAGDLRSAEALHDQAQLSWTAILNRICQSPEDEAEAVEAVFTDFEERLLKLVAKFGATRA